MRKLALISAVTSLIALAGCNETSVSGRISGQQVHLDEASFGITEQAAAGGVTARVRLVLRDSRTGVRVVIEDLPIGVGKQLAVAGTGPSRGFAAVVDVQLSDLDALLDGLRRHQRPLTAHGTLRGDVRLTTLLDEADASGGFHAEHDPALDQLLQ